MAHGKALRLQLRGPQMVLAIGLGEAIDRMLAIGMPRVEQHNLALAGRIYAAFARMPALKLVSPPPGPLATALVAARLPATVDSQALRIRMRDRHGISIKMPEKRWFNGIRLSPHLQLRSTDRQSSRGLGQRIRRLPTPRIRTAFLTVLTAALGQGSHQQVPPVTEPPGCSGGRTARP